MPVERFYTLMGWVVDALEIVLVAWFVSEAITERVKGLACRSAQDVDALGPLEGRGDWLRCPLQVLPILGHRVLQVVSCLDFPLSSSSLHL